jgi:hypothetical protein
MNNLGYFGFFSAPANFSDLNDCLFREEIIMARVFYVDTAKSITSKERKRY